MKNFAMGSTLKFGLIFLIACLVGRVTTAPLPTNPDSGFSALAFGNFLSSAFPKPSVKSSTGDQIPVVEEVEEYVDEALKKSEEKSKKTLEQKIKELRHDYKEQMGTTRSKPEMGGEANASSEQPMEEHVTETTEPEAGEIGGSVLKPPSSGLNKIDGIEGVKEEENLDDEVLSELKDDNLDDDLDYELDAKSEDKYVNALKDEGSNSEESIAHSADDDLDALEEDDLKSFEPVAHNADNNQGALDDQVSNSTGSVAPDVEDVDEDALENKRLNWDESVIPKEVGANSTAAMSNTELNAYGAY